MKYKSTYISFIIICSHFIILYRLVMILGEYHLSHPAQMIFDSKLVSNEYFASFIFLSLLSIIGFILCFTCFSNFKKRSVISKILLISVFCLSVVNLIPFISYKIANTVASQNKDFFYDQYTKRLASRMASYKSINYQKNALTTEALFLKFNMRSVRSSIAQQLEYYCESYPKDYFSIEKKTINRLDLKQGDRLWSLQIIEYNTILLTEIITTDTYRNSSRHVLSFNPINEDWHADDIWIDVPDNCISVKSKLN